MLRPLVGSALGAVNLVLFWATVVIPLVALASPARADAPRLNDDEQAEVNLAIDRGVKYLKKVQNQDGSWGGNPQGPFAGVDRPVGYTAIAGLALIECGVPAKDQIIQRAAYYVVSNVDKLSSTYELALAILFLDALPQEGNAIGKRIPNTIRVLAGRLIAGQQQTGGWNYTCPVLDNASHALLTKILKERDEALKTPKDEKAKPGVKKKPTTVPQQFYQYAVFTSPNRLTWTDGKGGETCNSNTQFAILGLWTARKYGTPVGPSFNLVVNRYRRSQNDDGGWAYRFAFPGGAGSAPAMTCCGLIGLAVGYALGIDMADVKVGLKDPREIKDPGAVVGGKPKPAADDAGNEGWRRYAGRACPRVADVIDPDPADKPDQAVDGTSMFKGFAYVANSVGKPTGKMKDLPMQNLYFMWSLERVAVLYNLTMLGDRDWYRWGAEILVANQGPSGAWEKASGYPGQTATLNTCFALLFLKRANLALDLTKKLPFDGSMLAAEIRNAAPPAPSPEPPKPVAAPSPEPPKPPQPQPVVQTPVKPPSMPKPEPEKVVVEEKSNGKLWLGLGAAALALVLIIGGGILAFLMMKDDGSKKMKKKVKVREDDDYAEEAEQPAPKKKKATKH